SLSPPPEAAVFLRSRASRGSSARNQPFGSPLPPGKPILRERVNLQDSGRLLTCKKLQLDAELEIGTLSHEARLRRTPADIQVENALRSSSGGVPEGGLNAVAGFGSSRRSWPGGLIASPLLRGAGLMASC